MRYQLTDQDRRIKTIAIEEHFSTPMQTQKSKKTEFRSFYLSSRSEHIGHSIVEQLADIDEQRLAYMDAAGIDIQVLHLRHRALRPSMRTRQSLLLRMPTSGSMRP